MLPKTAAEAVMRAVTNSVNLEFDRKDGRAETRDSHVEKLAEEKKLTGAEAAAAGKQQAAAVYLVLNTLGLKKE